MAQTFVVKRMKGKQDEKPLSPRTVEGNIGNLSIVFGHWFRDTLKIVSIDPFADVEPPKYDKKPPRIITAEESEAIFDWLQEDLGLAVSVALPGGQGGHRLPNRRAGSAVTAGLKDGRISFVSESTKGRKERACRLPPALFAELQAIAGPTYVFERFSEELREVHLKRGRPAPRQGGQGFHARPAGQLAPGSIPGLLRGIESQAVQATQLPGDGYEQGPDGTDCGLGCCHRIWLQSRHDAAALSCPGRSGNRRRRVLPDEKRGVAG